MNRSIRWNLLMITPLVALLMACPKPVNPTDPQAEAGQEIQITPISVYPRVLDYGVYSRQMMGGSFQYCGNVQVPNGGHIDLREKSCDVTNHYYNYQLPRYFGWVSVENPSNEALTYDWSLYVQGLDEYKFSEATTSSRIFYLDSWQTLLVTSDCYVTVKVNAPRASRSKGPFTVWAGTCTYYATRLI